MSRNNSNSSSESDMTESYQRRLNERTIARSRNGTIDKTAEFPMESRVYAVELNGSMEHVPSSLDKNTRRSKAPVEAVVPITSSVKTTPPLEPIVRTRVDPGEVMGADTGIGAGVGVTSQPKTESIPRNTTVATRDRRLRRPLTDRDSDAVIPTEDGREELELLMSRTSPSLQRAMRGGVESTRTSPFLERALYDTGQAPITIIKRSSENVLISKAVDAELPSTTRDISQANEAANTESSRRTSQSRLRRPLTTRDSASLLPLDAEVKEEEFAAPTDLMRVDVD
jgi:hypothetical protein